MSTNIDGQNQTVFKKRKGIRELYTNNKNIKSDYKESVIEKCTMVIMKSGKMCHIHNEKWRKDKQRRMELPD